MEDLLTIALPVYKRTDYIRSALDSAVNQTVKCRILLIDNNSPHDEFKKIIDSYKNPLIEYIKTDSTVPQDENFNNCFRYSTTPWVTILHDDDMLHCQFVELTQKIFKKYRDKVGGVVVTSHVAEKEWEGIYKKVKLTNEVKLVKEPFFYFDQLTPFPGAVINKKIALEIGGFNSSLHPIADFDFWYRYCDKANMLYVNQELTFYRISPTQSTVNLISAMINNVYEYRMALIKKGRYNNILSKLALEQSRLNNIRFFVETYPNVDIPENFINKEGLEKARKFLKIRLLSRIVWRYRLWISFGNP